MLEAKRAVGQEAKLPFLELREVSVSVRGHESIKPRDGGLVFEKLVYIVECGMLMSARERLYITHSISLNLIAKFVTMAPTTITQIAVGP